MLSEVLVAETVAWLADVVGDAVESVRVTEDPVAETASVVLTDVRSEGPAVAEFYVTVGAVVVEKTGDVAIEDPEVVANVNIVVSVGWALNVVGNANVVGAADVEVELVIVVETTEDKPRWQAGFKPGGDAFGKPTLAVIALIRVR